MIYAFVNLTTVQKIMNKIITPYLNFMKTNKNEIFMLKFIIVIIINIWLLFIFWRIILLNGLNFNNNNVFLTKMNTVMQPLLFALGIDYLSPNTIKMIMISIVILGVNLSVLYFNQMALLIISIGFARYGYKSYSNYLINQENMHYMGFETAKQPEMLQKPIIKTVEQTPIIIETATTTNWWLWGTVIALGVITVAGIAITIWSHNTNAGNMSELSTNTTNTLTNLNTKIDHVIEGNVRLKEQIILNSETTRGYVNNINTRLDLADNKIDNNFKGLEIIKDNYAKISELNKDNTLELSQKSLGLSEKAVNIMQEMSEISSATEGITIGLAKFYDIVNNFNERLTIVETRIDSITGIQPQTPRTINTINITKKHGEL